MRARIAAIGGLLTLFAAPIPLLAQSAAPAPAVELAISGRVEHPRTFSLADLQASPPVTVELSYVTGQGVTPKYAFTGALLWTLVATAVAADESGQRSHLQHTLMARGRDGYAVAFAIGELDPGFENKQVLVAYAQDGRPLPALRLIVPGDTRAGRAVRDLVTIEVR